MRMPKMKRVKLEYRMLSVVILLEILFLFAGGAVIGEVCDAACGLVALVPARGGSKGLPNKNIAILGNTTLLNNTLTIIKNSNVFESIWVSTDVEPIAKISEDAGVNVHWRAPETATDSATTLSAVIDFLSSHSDIRIVAVIQCTSPFLCPSWLKMASLAMKNRDVDCVFSSVRSFKLRWKKNADGYVKAENFDPTNRPRRQDWSGELYENGMFYFFRRNLVERGYIQNDKCRVVEVFNSRSLEIDTAMDLKIAESMLPVLEDCPSF